MQKHVATLARRRIKHNPWPPQIRCSRTMAFFFSQFCGPPFFHAPGHSTFIQPWIRVQHKQNYIGTGEAWRLRAPPDARSAAKVYGEMAPRHPAPLFFYSELYRKTDARTPAHNRTSTLD